MNETARRLLAEVARLAQANAAAQQALLTIRWTQPRERAR